MVDALKLIFNVINAVKVQIKEALHSGKFHKQNFHRWVLPLPQCLVCQDFAVSRRPTSPLCQKCSIKVV